MICSNCQYENEIGESVCANCGDALPSGERIVLYLLAYDESIAIDDLTEVVLGRSGISTDDHASVDLRDYAGQDHGVSRRHAMIQRRGDTIMIADLDSANGTYVNGARLTPQVRYTLVDGDEVYLGQLALTVYFV